MTRLNMSRPNWSVPKRCPSLNAGIKRFAGLVASGLGNGNTGANTTTTQINTSKNKPNVASRFPISKRHEDMGAGLEGAEISASAVMSVSSDQPQFATRQREG